MANQAFSDLGNFSLSDEKKEEYGIEGDIEYEHPEQAVQASRSKGILSTVCKKDVSNKVIDLSTYASHRSNTLGDGMYNRWDSRNELISNVLFNNYVVLMTGNYVEPHENSPLDYELEYVIAGKTGDLDNLKYVTTRLLLIRGVANASYFATDSTLRDETEAAATGLSLLCGIPELEKLLWCVVSSMDICREYSGRS